MSTIPTVYFIDDSATMREVIKIAFRRENINVVACHDAATALAEIETAKPDIVITDVIMPDKDGYDVCQHIKSHPALAKTPVILMSGVVNRAVAEKAFAVKADELLRKPFQPQDLIARVKHLLKSNGAPVPTPAAAANAAVALSSIFSAAAAAPMPPRSVPAMLRRRCNNAPPWPPRLRLHLFLQCHCQLRRQPRFLCPSRLPLQRLWLHRFRLLSLRQPMGTARRQPLSLRQTETVPPRQQKQRHSMMPAS